MLPNVISNFGTHLLEFGCIESTNLSLIIQREMYEENVCSVNLHSIKRFWST
jgi:hypothetical protein